MPSKMELVFELLVLACLCSFVAPNPQVRGDSLIRWLITRSVSGDALIALKDALNASTDQLKNWNQNQVNPCTWTKVTCDSNYNVTLVSLSSMGFSGSLSPKIGALNTLQTLYV
ncbi:hypothetical protein CsSME_00006332 [Camellia sinensis var. sinensis]